MTSEIPEGKTMLEDALEVALPESNLKVLQTDVEWSTTDGARETKKGGLLARLHRPPAEMNVIDR